MKLIYQLKNYWNKLRLNKYKKGTKIEFIHKVNKIPGRYTGVVDEIYEQSQFPYCVKLDVPIEYNGWTVSYVNITKKQII